MMEMIATCPEETKDTTVQELKSLGARDVTPLYRAVRFKADDQLFYEIHLRARTVSRFLLVVRDFAVKSPEMLFSHAKRVRWDRYFKSDATFLIEGVAGDRGPEYMSSNEISKKVREGLQDSFQHHTGKVPKVDLKDPKVVVVAFVYRGRCTISLDTCGKVLHKRGYRMAGHPAPVKETLAASLLQIIGYDGSQPFLDPMCGSGTIAIEAAMVAVHKAPQIHRKKGQFLFENLLMFDKDLWRETQDRIRDEKLEAPVHLVAASDISKAYVDMARDNALRARVEKYITFNRAAFQDLKAPAPNGILVTNLPYGDRIGGDPEEVRKLYEEIGNTLKHKFSGWRAGLLASEESPHKFIGLKPTRKIPVMNGSIACKFLIYDLYAGTKRVKTAQDNV